MSDGSASTAGRTQLLAWLNALCQTRLERVEQLRSGAVACQVLDALFPGRVPMSRVDWAAASERHFVANFMLLQRALAAVGERRPLPVDRLVRGSYLDNLELLQWLNDLCVRRGGGGPRHYDAAAWREKGRGGAEFNRLFGAGGAAPAPAVKPRKSPTPRRTGRLCSGGDAVAVDYAAMLERKMQGLKIQSDAAEQEQEQLAAQMKELQQQLEATAAERDFYVKKLAAIEELVHNVELAKTNNAQTNMLGLAILDVLYATVEDDEEFVPF